MQRWLDERAKEKGRPFFLYYALNLPHANNEAGKDSPLGHGLESPSYGEFAARDWPDVEKGFASVMKFVDGEVGAVLAKVKALGLDENTIVFFSSDNGPHQEGGHHVAQFQSNDGLTGHEARPHRGRRARAVHRALAGKNQTRRLKRSHQRFRGFPRHLRRARRRSGRRGYGRHFLSSDAAGKQRQQKPHPYLFWNFLEQGGKRSVLKWPWKLIHLNTGRNRCRQPKAKQAKPKPLAVELYNLEPIPPKKETWPVTIRRSWRNWKVS